MTPGELVEEVSSALGAERASIAVHDRNLVIAGLRSKAGRGPNASARMMPRDAASLLTAVLGSIEVRDSAATVRRFLATSVISSSRSQEPGTAHWTVPQIPEFDQLPGGHSFVDALEALITSAASGSFRSSFKTAFRTGNFPLENLVIEVSIPGVVADVMFKGRVSRDMRSMRYAGPGSTDGGGQKGLIRRNEIRGDVILHIGEALAGGGTMRSTK